MDTHIDSEAEFGITIPFDGVTLEDHREWIEELPELGYTDAWTGEANAADGFTPLALAATWAPASQPRVRPWCPCTRGDPGFSRCRRRPSQSLPPADSPSASARLRTSSSSGGTRSRSIEPYQRVRDTVRFLKSALAGEKVDAVYETFEVHGFRLDRRPEMPPPIYVAALRSGMLKLAGREADGAIINWLSPEDVKTVAPLVGDGKAVVARIFVCPSEDAEQVRSVGRMVIAAYLNVEVYAEFHRWLGRAPQLEGMWTAWRSGDRKGR